MADFWQHGMITTLQKLKERPLEEMEAELLAVSRRRKMVLLLPALFSEFESEAMPRIIEELKSVNYLHRIVLSLDRAGEKEFIEARKFMSVLPTNVKVIWHDGPGMQAMRRELQDADFDIDYPGKGRSVWMSLGYVLADPETYAVALHDCDIVNYRRELLSRLFYPVVHPAINFEFSKGYYARFSGKLYGRVMRLFYSPLITALRRILGYNIFLSYLDNFRYALSGEFAVISTLGRIIRISPTWGLEVSLLSEVFQRTSVNRICQVEVLDSYEHKHQVLAKDQPSEGLIRMASDIAKALFMLLAQDGIVMSQSFFRTLLALYTQESRNAVEKYNALSLLNGLDYDRHGESEASEAFVNSLQAAMEEFVENPVGIPMLPAWNRVDAAIPDFSDRLIASIEKDN